MGLYNHYLQLKKNIVYVSPAGGGGDINIKLHYLLKLWTVVSFDMVYVLLLIFYADTVSSADKTRSDRCLWETTDNYIRNL